MFTRPVRPVLAIGLALVAFGLGACHKRSKSSDGVAIDQPHPPDMLPGRELLATLDRAGCFGECPVYRLTVFRDGSVVYVGTRWVKVSGRQEFAISQEKLDALEAAFTRAGFLQMRDYDRVEGTDDDWAHLSYRHGGVVKHVRHYRGDPTAPAVLSMLEDDFDRLTDSRRFVGSAAPAGSAQLTALPAPSGVASGALRPNGAASAPASAPAPSAPPASRPHGGAPSGAPDTQE